MTDFWGFCIATTIKLLRRKCEAFARNAFWLGLKMYSELSMT